MMRVGLVTHGMEIGGIERSIARIASGLDRERFEPIVFSLTRTGPASEWLPEGVTVVEIEKRTGNDWSAIGRLTASLRQHQIAVVQSHNWGTLVETVLARKLAAVPTHIHAERGTVMGTVNPHGLKHRCRALAMRAALRSVDQVISNSVTVAQRVEMRCGYPASRITCIPNGVPSPVVNDMRQLRVQIRRELGLSEDTFLVGSVGRLHLVKGFEALLRAMAVVAGSNRSAHLVLVGDGDQRDPLRNLASQLEIPDRVHFVGHRDDTHRWFSAFDLYVNSSLSEGMSQSIVEAMSYGLPIAATDVGDSRRLITHEGLECGKVCVPGEIHSLASVIELILGDRDMAQRFSRNAKSCHDRYYSETRFIQSMQYLYHNVHCSSLKQRTARRGPALGSDWKHGECSCPLQPSESNPLQPGGQAPSSDSIARGHER